MNENKPERHDSWELFEYSIACLSKKRLATAQVFWAISFENYIKSKYEKLFNRKTPWDKNAEWVINEIYTKETFAVDLQKLRKRRNDIIHKGFLTKEEFDKCLSEFLKLFDKEKTIEEIRKNVVKERQTDLALKFNDRVFYDGNERQLKKCSRIAKNIFYNDSELERSIWRLKYKIKSLFWQDKKQYEGLQTGLISDFGISSEWIWLPVGFDIAEGNNRVQKAIISILIFRDRKIRVYLDFGTDAIKPREEYYRLLKTNEINKHLKSLILRNSNKNISFWNVNHYSMIEDNKISIKDWLEGENTATVKVKDLIMDEKKNWEYKDRRGNILLFGFEEKIETESVDELAQICVGYIDELLPCLKAIEKNIKNNEGNRQNAVGFAYA